MVDFKSVPHPENQVNTRRRRVENKTRDTISTIVMFSTAFNPVPSATVRGCSVSDWRLQRQRLSACCFSVDSTSCPSQTGHPRKMHVHAKVNQALPSRLKSPSFANRNLVSRIVQNTATEFGATNWVFIETRERWKSTKGV